MKKTTKKDKKMERPIRVRDLLLLYVISLREKAWAYLGALSHEETGEKLVSLEDARLAIDALDRLVELIKPSLSKDEVKSLELDLSNLRLNYVSQVEKGNREEKPKKKSK